MSKTPEATRLGSLNGLEWPAVVGVMWEASRPRFATRWNRLPRHDQVAVYRLLLTQAQKIEALEMVVNTIAPLMDSHPEYRAQFGDLHARPSETQPPRPLYRAPYRSNWSA